MKTQVMTISKFYSTWAVILLLAMAVTAEDEKESSIQMTDDENHDAKSSDYTRLTVERLRSLAQVQVQSLGILCASCQYLRTFPGPV